MRTLSLPVPGTDLLAAIATAGEPTTPNGFLARGVPTLVAGTTGDNASDGKIRAQIDLLRGMLFPKSKVILDTDIDLRKGPDPEDRDREVPEVPLSGVSGDVGGSQRRGGNHAEGGG